VSALWVGGALADERRLRTRVQVPVPVHTAKNDDIAVLPPFEGSLEIGRYWTRAPTIIDGAERFEVSAEGFGVRF